MASEVYWQIRGAANSCRDWLTSYHVGPKTGTAWFDLWNVAESADISLDVAYRTGGFPALCQALSADDRIENWMTRLAAEVAREKTGDDVMADELLSGRPPGASHLAPEWALQGARDNARAVALQRARMRTGRAAEEGEVADPSARRPRRRGGAGGTAPKGGAGSGQAASTSTATAKAGGRGSGA